MKEKIIQYIKSGGGAIQFHYMNELFISIIDEEGNITSEIQSMGYDTPSKYVEVDPNIFDWEYLYIQIFSGNGIL